MHVCVYIDICMCTHIYIHIYGWLSKLHSFFGTECNTAPIYSIYIGDPNGDHSFDNHPYLHAYTHAHALIYMRAYSACVQCVAINS